MVGRLVDPHGRDHQGAGADGADPLLARALAAPPEPERLFALSARALAAPPEPERLFALSARALVEGLLAGPPAPAAMDITDIEGTEGGAVGRGPYSQ
ncbi:hypothetical protein ACF1CG_21190 [Streptomyces sp. NPDC014773]|uniref:hypothetical protein n=1 Tax=Streptomyces sp. NPDC014773 TaxID=3364908 RepID=UPI0036FDCF58